MTPSSQTLSVGEALALAIELHQHAHLHQAEQLYRQILQAIPDQPDALHFLGVLSHQRGRTQEAVELIRQAIALHPNYADAHNNLGNVLKEQGNLQEAAAAYRQVIALNPNHAQAHNNLGILLKAQGKLAEAIAAYCKAVTLDPQYTEAFYNLGNALVQWNKYDQAIDAYRSAIGCNPDHIDVYEALGSILCSVGKSHEALTVYQQWLAIDPGNPIAQHMIAACSGSEVPTRASNCYVQQLFDQFANDFDERLHRLQYRAPELVAGLVAAQFAVPKRQLDVLDAGCGTGLCGPLLRPYARCLTGADLSPGMLQKANQRQVYDELVAAELTVFLSECIEAYDFIVSADTLVYFGDLQPVLTAAANALRPAGRLLFTVENAKTEDATRGFRLNTHGRYSHTEDYVKHALTTAGLGMRVIVSDILRLDMGQPVSGHIVLASK